MYLVDIEYIPTDKLINEFDLPIFVFRICIKVLAQNYFKEKLDRVLREQGIMNHPSQFFVKFIVLIDLT